MSSWLVCVKTQESPLPTYKNRAHTNTIDPCKTTGSPYQCWPVQLPFVTVAHVHVRLECRLHASSSQNHTTVAAPPPPHTVYQYHVHAVSAASRRPWKISLRRPGNQQLPQIFLQSSAAHTFAARAPLRHSSISSLHWFSALPWRLSLLLRPLSSHVRTRGAGRSGHLLARVVLVLGAARRSEPRRRAAAAGSRRRRSRRRAARRAT